LAHAYGDWMEPRGGPLVVHTHDDGGRFDVGELSCWVRRVDHHPHSLGIRISAPEGASIAYLGDTDLCDAAVELCRNVDVAIVECSWPDDHEGTGHMCPRKVAALARAAEPTTLLLTHLYPEMDEFDVVDAVRAHGCPSSVV